MNSGNGLRLIHRRRLLAWRARPWRLITWLNEKRTGWSITRFVRTARRYRTATNRVGLHTISAEDPLPAELRDALSQIN